MSQTVNTVVKPVVGMSGAAFVPFGKRPLEFVTCFKVTHFFLLFHDYVAVCVSACVRVAVCVHVRVACVCVYV